MDDKAMMCGCPHHKIVPGLVILFGLLFLLGAYDVFTMRTVQIVWPILVIVAGLMKISQGSCKCCKM